MNQSVRVLGRGLLPLAFLALFAALPASAETVVDWNHELIDSIRANRTNPPVATRQAAILNVSIFDAIQGVNRTFHPYHVTDLAPAPASADAAAAAAAHAALSTLYPARRAQFDAVLAAQLAAIPDGAAKDNGVSWGEDVAAAILALRATDGATATVKYTPPTGAFWWVPTPPAFAPPLAPQWPYVTPWTLHSGDQFRAPGPPTSPSEERYVRDYYEVKTLGRATGSTRTADQSQIALFWNDGAGTSTPPGHWNLIAQELVTARHLGLVESARLFALLSIVQADAAIVAWDNKYHFHHWRPVTAIQNAREDGNPATMPDAEWTSFIITPPFPTYTSGHSTFSGSSARLLALFLGDDAIAFTTGSDGTPGVERSFDSLSEAAEEAGQSRIYGGIHWQYDNRDAIAGGRALAEYAFANFLRPLADAGGHCVPSGEVLCLHGDRFSVTAEWRSSPTEAGEGHALPGTFDSGAFAFFSHENAELLVKVLDGCGVNGHMWVFTGGATTVEYIVNVTDHETGHTETYFNPLYTPGRATTDIDAFVCP